MVPPPSQWHQEFGTELLALLKPLAKAKGLILTYETGLFQPGEGERNYRQPDLMAYSPALRTERGVEGPAELVVEILSPNDETYEKIPFYESLGVSELLVLNPETRVPEAFLLRGKKLLPMTADEKGAVRSSVLSVSFAPVEGPRLRVVWAQGEASI